MIATGQPVNEIEEEVVEVGVRLGFRGIQVELLRPQLARLVLFLPAFWLLVPGSLGLIGVTQLVADQGQVVQTVLDVVAVVCAIALGLLVGSALGLALRNRLRPAPTLI